MRSSLRSRAFVIGLNVIIVILQISSVIILRSLLLGQFPILAPAFLSRTSFLLALVLAHNSRAALLASIHDVQLVSQ